MAEQDLQRVAAAFDPFRSQTLRAAQIGLVGTDAGDAGKYRPISTKSAKDLLPMQYRDVCIKAFYLWQRNPMAKRLISIPVNFITGEELKVKAGIKKRVKDKEDIDTGRKDAQQVWDDFWEDPINKLNTDFPSIVTDQFINGEIAMPATVNPSDGKVRLGYYITTDIEEVACVPGNAREIDTIKLKEHEGAKTKDLLKKVIRYNVDGTPETNENFGKLSGEVFYFQINKLPSQLRGYSELIGDIDWLDADDQFAFGVIDGFDARNDYFYDCMMKGVTPEKLKAMKVERPARGEVNLHNENATWEVMTPDLKASDATVGMKAITQRIAGMKGYPPTWFGEGQTSNRSTAEEMAVPTMMLLKAMGTNVKNMVKFMALFVLQEAARDGRTIKLAADEYFDIDISTFDLDSKDVERAGAGISALISALVLASTRNWVSNNTAKKVVDAVISSVGIETESGETVEDIAAENEDALAEDVLNTPAKKVTEFLPEGD